MLFSFCILAVIKYNYLKKIKESTSFSSVFFNEAKKKCHLFDTKKLSQQHEEKKVVLYFHHEGMWVAGMDVSSDSKTTFLKLNGNTAAITDLSDCWALKAHD